MKIKLNEDFIILDVIQPQVNNMTKKIVTHASVLIDLMGYGIVEMPIDYTLLFDDVETKSCLVECHLKLINPSFYSWIHSAYFSLIYCPIAIGNGHSVTIKCDGLSKNIYYRAMLNAVSDYIFYQDCNLIKYLKATT